MDFRKVVLFAGLFTSLTALSQTGYDVLKTDSLSLNTDARHDLVVQEFSTDSLFETASDHGGYFRIYEDSCGIQKVEVTLFYSFGVFYTSLYLEYGYIYLIREQEYHYPVNELTDQNYDQPELIYEGNYYRHDLDSVSVITSGERLLLDQFCSLLEFDVFYDLACELTRPKN